MSWGTWFISQLRSPAHHNLEFLYELRHMVHLSIDGWDFPFLIPPCFYQTLYSYSTKSVNSLTLKPHNFFQTENIRKATHIFAPKDLIFKFQQEVWRFYDIYMSWSFPKTDLETVLLNLISRSFEYVTLSQ